MAGNEALKGFKHIITSQVAMMAVKLGNREIKHCDSDVGQIKQEKWISDGLVAKGWGQK